MSNAFDKASLVMLPHAYEEGKLYSLKPTDRSGDFTFSRGADTATRVGEDGYIKKEHSNLLLQSNQFDTTWTTANASVTGGQAGYDGLSNAWLLENNQVANSSNLQQIFSSSSVNAYSVYAKAGTTNWLNLRTEAAGKSVWFDLGNGVIGTEKASTISSSIESVGDGWYRLSIAFDSCTAVRFYVADGDNSFAVTLGANVYIQDAQLNQGLVATPYLETTTAPVFGGLTDNMPRLDYTDATCPSLLLEPERTNEIPHSEYLNFSQYNKINSTVIEDNAAVSPEGVQNASKVKSGVSASTTIGFENTSTTSEYRTFSMFAKAEEINEILIFGVQVGQGVYFDLNDGSVLGYYQGNSSQITDAYSIPMSNGWYRYVVIWASNSKPRIFNSLNQQITFLQTNGDGYYAYGLQSEDATYPTSYIPTYGSAQTRVGENLGLLGVSEFGQLTSLEDGTAFFEAKINALNNQNRYLYIARGSLANFWSTTTLYLYNTGGGFLQWGSLPNVTTLENTSVKIAFKKEGLNVTLFVNGTNYGVKTIASGETISGWEQFTTYQNGSQSIEQYLEFPTALSDSECIALTTQA